MLKKYEKLFSIIDNPKTPFGLLDRILARIESEKSLAVMRRKIFMLSAFLLASFPVIAYSWISLQDGISKTGLLRLISLVFTDFSVVASHYQDFIMSIAESLPILAIAGLLGGALLFVESSLALARDIRITYKLKA